MKENKTQEKESKKPKAGLHDGHRERMRERFKLTRFDGMQEHEMLEMLLYYSIPRVNTNEYAHELLNYFGSLEKVFEADIDGNNRTINVYTFIYLTNSTNTCNFSINK